jgi:multisubunit Na+/H+ antiporter MnhB subunit
MVSVVAGFVVLYGAYVAANGHAAPGGGFSGGVMIMAGVVLIVLSYGGNATRELTAEWRCQLVSGAGALSLVVLGLGGMLAVGKAFLGNLWPDRPVVALLLSDLCVCVMVGAGLTGVFLALVVATRRAMPDKPKE